MNKQELLKEHLIQVVHINQIQDLIHKKIMERIPTFLSKIKEALINSDFTVNTNERCIFFIIDGIMNDFEKEYIQAAYLFKSGFSKVEIVTNTCKQDDGLTTIKLYYQLLDIEQGNSMKVVQDGIKPAETKVSIVQNPKEQFMTINQNPKDYLEEK